MQDRAQHLEKVVEELTARVNHLEQILAKISSVASGISTGKDPVSKDPVSKDPVSKDPVSKDPISNVRKDDEPVGPILKEDLTDKYFYIAAAGKFVYAVNNEYKLFDLSQVHTGGKPRLMVNAPNLYTLVVTESGQLLGTDLNRRVTRYQGEMAGTWEILGGLGDFAMELFIRPDNSIYAITNKGETFRFKEENKWEQVPNENQLQQVSVSTPEHGSWGTNPKNEIFQQQEGGKWERIPGTLRWVSAGHGGVWGVNPQGTLYHYLGAGNWERVEGAPEGILQVAVANNVVYGIIGLNEYKAWQIILKK
jgi:hypothetical protein